MVWLRPTKLSLALGAESTHRVALPTTRVYSEEEICQCKRDSYKKHYYVTHKEACIERARESTMHKKLIAQQPQAV